MFYQILSASIQGMDVRLIEVQADISDGLPVFDMVGLPGSEVRESRERVRTALRNSGIRLPAKRITVNFSPADLKKEGTAFDLPVAAAILGGIQAIPPRTDDCLILGELGLDGSVLPVRGCISVAKEAEASGCRRIILPAKCASQCRMTSGLECIGVHNLSEMIRYLRDGTMPADDSDEEEFPETALYPDFADLGGLEVAKRAAEIAAAGRHHLLIEGPPGAGKSMLAACIPGILPEPDAEERKIQMELRSLAGDETMHLGRPFRHPESNISASAMIGGGKGIRPGELALAHQGILFLDELPTFSSSVFYSLRLPMEEGKVELTRNGQVYGFPADFQLIAAMNPCPCGYYPDRQRCNCTPEQRFRYKKRIDGPFLDRVDLFLSMQQIDYEDVSGKRGPGESSETIRERVSDAWEIQKERYKEEPFHSNAKLTPQAISRYCRLGVREEEMMEQCFSRYHLSGRGYHKILKTARTIADLDHMEQIQVSHIREAVFYRVSEDVSEGRRYH